MQDKNVSSAVTRLRHNSPTTDKSLKLSNYVQEITSFQPPMVCPLHYQDTISYICIDCQYKCLCGTCLQEGSHKSHHIKNIEKGSHIVGRVLNESLIRLRSKSDLLSSLKDYIQIRKSQIFVQYSEYEQTFNINFQSLAIALAEKRRELLQGINQYHQQLNSRIDQLIQSINEESVLTLELINTVQHNIDKLKQYPTSLCLFFESSNLTIENMVQDAPKNFDMFKHQVPDVKWIVDLEIFDVLKNSINTLCLDSTPSSIQLCCNFYNCFKNTIKPVEIKLEKTRSNQMLACRTPKNLDGNKMTMQGQLKSPPSCMSRKSKGKLNSMPASPNKEKSPKKRSAGKAKLEEVSKKFKKQKK